MWGVYKAFSLITLKLSSKSNLSFRGCGWVNWHPRCWDWCASRWAKGRGKKRFFAARFSYIKCLTSCMHMILINIRWNYIISRSLYIYILYIYTFRLFTLPRNIRAQIDNNNVNLSQVPPEPTTLGAKTAPVRDTQRLDTLACHDAMFAFEASVDGQVFFMEYMWI